MNTDVSKLYGNKLRVRVCGICVQDNAILMINHTGLTENDFWAPPGGGINIGESAPEALIREFKEETGITVSVGAFLFACEFINPPLHAVELFFEVRYKSGEIKKGTDPEMSLTTQIIKDVRWLTFSELENTPSTHLHGAFKVCGKPAEILQLTGFWRI